MTAGVTPPATSKRPATGQGTGIKQPQTPMHINPEDPWKGYPGMADPLANLLFLGFGLLTVILVASQFRQR